MKYSVAVFVLAWISIIHAQTVPEETKPREFPFEPANAIVRYDCTRVVVEADGKSNALHHYRVAVLTDRAIRNYAEDNTVYNLGYDTVEVVSAKVYLPSGEVVEVGDDAIKDVPMPAFRKFFLQNVREKILTFPKLEKGAEIEVAYREITREAPMDGQFDMTEVFQNTDPIKFHYVEILAPTEMNLHWKARNGEIPYVSHSEGDKTRHIWQVEDTPQLVPEPGMPPFIEVAPQLLVSSVDNWQTWSRWYDALAEPEMKADGSIKEKVLELTSHKTSQMDKLREIFYYVSNNIRYVETALTGRKAGYKPEAASVTFQNKYGVCRDKAALLVTMLREAGIPSNIVLMNPVWKIDPDVAADQFNHAIVAAYVNGHKIWVDPTVEKTKDFLAASEQDKAVLVCDSAGEDLAWTPIEPPEQNLFRIRAESQLGEGGDFVSNVTITSHGFPDLILRNVLQSIPPDRQTQLFKRLVQRIHPTAQLDSLRISDLMDFTKDVEIFLKLRASKYSIPANRFLLFEIPGQSSGLDFLTGYLLGGTDLVERRFDLRLESTFAVQVEETVKYPNGYRVRSLPETVDMNYGDFRLARNFSQKKNSITVQRVLDFSTLDVNLNEYSKLQELLQKNESMSRGKVVLVKS